MRDTVKWFSVVAIIKVLRVKKRLHGDSKKPPQASKKPNGSSSKAVSGLQMMIRKKRNLKVTLNQEQVNLIQTGLAIGMYDCYESMYRFFAIHFILF